MSHHGFAQKHLINRSFISYLLYPASNFYAGYMRFRRKFLFRAPYRAKFKVVSIGNLTSGGSGKSPIAIALAKELRERGLKVAYSSRGYRSALEEGATLIYDANGFCVPLQSAGDEAVMVARALQDVPVFCGRDRSGVLALAEKLYPDLDLMILDDAFQHLKVARDLDLVVFDARIGLGNGFTIPAGYLREDLSALGANCLNILHQKPLEQPNPQLEQTLLSLATPLYRATSSSAEITKGSVVIDVESIKGKGIALVSAIAQPESFENSVREQGIEFVRHHIFNDHHSFTDAKSIALLQNDPARYLICTAKDAPKLEPILGDRLLTLGMKTQLDPALIGRVLQLFS